METISQSLTRLRLSSNASKLFEAKRIGVALGPGLPIGLVDFGMLIALKQLKIPVSMISGTSMGAVVGALYASGLTPEEIREKATALFSRDGVKKLLIEDMKFPRFGLSSADKLINEIINNIAGWDPEFHELMIPLFITAADKVSQKSVILRHGRVFDAVRASLAMPIIMTRQKIGTMHLADGAIFSPLNTEILYAEGADFVIGIQAKPIRGDKIRSMPLRAASDPFILRALGWKTNRDIIFSKPACDILLRPRVPRYLAKDGTRADEIINLGIKITYDAVHAIEQGNVPQIKSMPASEPQTDEDPIQKIEKQLENQVTDLESYLVELEKKTEKMSDADLIDLFPKFTMELQCFLDRLNQLIPEPNLAAETLKLKFQDFMHLVDKSPFMSRALHKPLGYAGDYQMMNYLYDDKVLEAESNMGKLLNYFFFSRPEANAVRNRAQIVQGIVQQRLALTPSIHIASIACGPAREVSKTIQIFSRSAKNAKMTWTLLDQDKEALEYARKGIPQNFELNINLLNAGVGELIKKRIELGQQDVIYSLGLFDYLENKVATILIQRLYDQLNPGGILLIGNFHPHHPVRVLMEGVMEWQLIYRTEEELLSLGKAGAPEGRHFVMAEPEGVNLILVTSKPLEA